MRLGQKVRYLRTVEGGLRGLDRPLTQIEVVRAMKRELKKSLSQAYLSQIENGHRPHITAGTRDLLARFYKVHPGFLVDDPPGFEANLTADLGTSEGKLDVWFVHLAERFHDDAQVSEALERIAGQKDTRGAVLLLGSILKAPGILSLVKAELARAEGTPKKRAPRAKASPRRQR